jgi:hypothetical protein
VRLLYANCTANVAHTGCLAVTDSQVRSLLSRGHVLQRVYYLSELCSYWTGDAAQSIENLLNSEVGQQLAQADGVVVNGEGTIHHGQGRDLLCLLAAGQRLGKASYLVNAVIQSVEGFDDVLRGLDDLTVRDALSGESLDERQIPHRVVPDSIVDAVFAAHPDVDLSGAVVFTDWHRARDRDVGRSVWRYGQRQANAFFYPLSHACEAYRWRHAVANWKQAEVVVTARHHGVYIAGLAGVPFVALPSNTHKVEGTIKMAGLPIPFCEHGEDLEAHVQFAKRNRGIFEDFRSFLLDQRPLSMFDKLPAASGPTMEAEDVEAQVQSFFWDVHKLHVSQPELVNAYQRRFFRRERRRDAAHRLLAGPQRLLRRLAGTRQA